MKYAVYWILTQHVSIPCPDANKVDEFGRKSMTACCVNHVKEVKEKVSKEFFDKDLAQDFYDRLKKESSIDSIFSQTKISDVEFKEIEE